MTGDNVDMAQKVREQYSGIDLDYLSEKSEVSDYHDKCLDFVSEYWESDIRDLTAKQETWLEKIENDCMRN